MEEVWNRVVGWEAAYEVSSLGRVRSIARVSESYGGRKWLRPAKIIKQRSNEGGYLMVNLSDMDRYQSFAVHRLVALAFLGPCQEEMTVNHKDGNKRNNAFSNLEYCTMADNLRHALKTGLRVNPCGSRNGGAKLSEATVAEIKGKLGRGERQAAIAKAYGVSRSLVSQIALGQIWQHI